MTKKLSILGSTGSIGRQTLDVVRQMDVQVVALTADRNVERMEAQCREFLPKLAVMMDETAANVLKTKLSDLNIQVLSGMDGLMKAATCDADTVITAVVGMVGLRPTLAAISLGKRIGLANKETLVCGGDLVMAAAKTHGAEIIPVDSEHSAIFQCLMGCEDGKEVKKLILTASGGPFFNMERAEIANVTKHDALKHPNWKMGEKITIDCASMMNKGLEVMEAMHLYGVPLEQVDVVVHRQSIVHSLVEFCDGAVMAQLGTPDMRIPIQLALTYPHRMPSPAPALDLLTCGDLTFHKPDMEKFPCLRLAMEAARKGGSAGAILNGANEAAVELFLAEKIGFYDISDLVSLAMSQVAWTETPSLEEILQADKLARMVVKSKL
ncbi:MAG: 1-deoxy-D-xylulose-5-phosphate reductoisomerase [Eubacteriales bacterium]